MGFRLDLTKCIVIYINRNDLDQKENPLGRPAPDIVMNQAGDRPGTDNRTREPDSGSRNRTCYKTENQDHQGKSFDIIEKLLIIVGMTPPFKVVGHPETAGRQMTGQDMKSRNRSDNHAPADRWKFK